ncbi:MAG: hypothetical protein DLM61_20470 [Pseudonocardiales bacterium]|nr:MAG: hypothetical protein DLM61_20470 [Pseudonocardiales bacterium]
MACFIGVSKNGWLTRHRDRPRDYLSVGTAVHLAADRCRTAVSARLRDRGFVDETYVRSLKLRGLPYRAIDQFGQVIDVLAAESGI